MVTSTPAGSWQLRWIIVGAVAGAVVRHLAIQTWDTPAHLLLITLIVLTISGFAMGAALTWPVRQQFRSFTWGAAGAAASLSGYNALAIDQPALSALTMLLLAPVCALSGLCGGAVLGLRSAPARGEDTLS